jgi:hypothetical protein
VAKEKEQGFKIVQFTAENFMKLKAVSINPTTAAVLITGRNEQGKSAILNGIMSTLCGKKFCPDKPVRAGQEKGFTSVDMGAFKATRTYTAEGGGTIIVESKDGFKAKSPQSMLDEIVGEIAFDPMNFIKLGETEAGRKEQRSILMKLVGLDFADLDKQIFEVKAQRSTANADKTRLGVELAKVPFEDGLAPDEISSSVVMEKITKANQHNASIAAGKVRYMQLNGEVLRQQDHITAMDKRVEEIQNQLTEYQKQREVEVKTLAEMTTSRDAAAATGDITDLAPIQAELSTVEDVNKKIRQNRTHKDLSDKLEAAGVLFSTLGDEMKKLETQKAERLSKTKFPLEGIGVDSAGVTYNGLPLSQECASRKLKIGVAISMAMNPKLKVIRMNGNELDADSLKVVSEMVEAEGYQAWIERIDSSGIVGFVIEDGEIVPSVSEGEPVQPGLFPTQ